MFRDELADRGDERTRDFHHCLIRIPERTLIFICSLVLRLPFVVREDALHSLFVPANRELVLTHLFPRCRRRRRYAARGAPRNVYAVITNTLSGSGSGT